MFIFFKDVLNNKQKLICFPSYMDKKITILTTINIFPCQTHRAIKFITTQLACMSYDVINDVNKQNDARKITSTLNVVQQI
jgi:hypothetical protein